MSKTTKMSVIDDATLLKMAEQEILGEAKRAAARHSIAGVSGWQPCSKPNKIFLTNTLLRAMASNRILAKGKVHKSAMGKRTERKLLRTGAVGRNTNFVYKKPKEIPRKCLLNASSNKCSIKSNSENEQSRYAKEIKKKCSSPSVQLKKA